MLLYLSFRDHFTLLEADHILLLSCKEATNFIKKKTLKTLAQSHYNLTNKEKKEIDILQFKKRTF